MKTKYINYFNFRVEDGNIMIERPLDAGDSWGRERGRDKFILKIVIFCIL